MKTKRLIIFDMDGVILDSEPLHKKSREMLYEELGIHAQDKIPNPVGESSSGHWRKVIAVYRIKEDPYALEARQYHLVAQQIKEKKIPVSEGLYEVLDWAKRQGMLIGLASSSTRKLVEKTLHYLEIKNYFDYIVCGDEVETKKPAPDIYVNVLKEAGVLARQAVAVEDSAAGVEAAKNAGIFCFGYSNESSGNQNLLKADVIISNLEEILVFEQ